MLAALLVRLAAIGIDGAYAPQHDAFDYHRHGVSIAAGEGYPESEFVPGGGPSALRAPGYPVALGAVYALAGDHVLAGRLLNAVLGALAVALLIALTRRIWGDGTALAAGGLAAFYPPLVGISTELFSENLFVPLVLGMALAVLRARETGELRWAAGAGALAGLCALARGPGLVLLVPLAIGLWTLRPRRSARSLARPALGVACALLVLAPWTVRNLAEFGRVVPVNTAAGFGLSGTYNEVSFGDRARWRTPVVVPEVARLFAQRDLDEGELDRELGEAARAFARDHPDYVLEVAGRNLVRLAYLDGAAVVGRGGEVVTERGIGNRGTVAEKAGFALAVLLALLGVVAIARARRRRGTIPAMLPSGPVFLWLVPLALVAAAAVAAGLPRYRVAADPFLLIAAAIGVRALWSRRRAAVAAAAVLALGGCGSSGEPRRTAPAADPEAVATWIERAERLCRAATRDAERLGDRFRGTEGDLERRIDEELVAPGLRVRERQARRLRALGPPPPGARDLETFAGLFDPTAELLRLRLAASRKGDREAAKRYEELVVALGGEQLEAARAAGMRDCARDLSAFAVG